MHSRAFRLILTGIIGMMTFVTARAQLRTVLFDSAEVQITKLACNTPSSDYAPSFCAGGVIFSSDRPHGFGVLTSDSLTADNLYFIRKPGSSPEFITRLNTLLQEGTSSYSSSDGVLYFSATVSNNRQQVGIYASTRSTDGSWSKSVPVIMPDGNFSYFQPCIIDNGNTLLFASDKTGGFGGTDLYRSVKQGGKWSEPENLGSSINSDGNEGYPSFCAPGFLIFSSNKHGSIGGYDNFCCTYKAGIAYDIIPVGDKLNTAADDFGMIYDPATRIGYLTSNRDMSTGDDIYEFSLAWPQFSNCVTHVAPRYCYTFSEENSMKSSDGALFYYQWNFGDGTTANALEADHCFSGPGIYTVELVIRDRIDTSFFLSQVVYEHEIAEKPGLRINTADTVFVGDSVSVNTDHSNLEGYSILQHYWDFGDHFLLKREQLEYVPTESGTIALQLGVAAQAINPIRYDTGPGEEYFCTEKTIVVLPANEKQAWLAKQRIHRHSDTVKADGVPVFELSQIENPEYTVFLGSSKDSLVFPQPGTEAIIRILKEDTVYRYLYGSAENMHAVHADYVQLKTLGIDSAFVIVLSNDTIVAHQINPDRDFGFTELISNLVHDTIPNAAIIPVNVLTATASDTLAIYFNVNESILNRANKLRVDTLLNTSRGSTYRLIAFSDQSGDDAFNLRLSKTRSNAVSSYLLSNGVKRTSVIQDAYGEQRPNEFRSVLDALEHERCVLIISTPAPNN